MYKKQVGLAALVLPICLAHKPSFSQSNNQHPSVETITVAGISEAVARPKIAGSVSTISQAQITASGAVSIVDLLRTVAGVNIGQTGPTGSLAELRFRGSESNHVLVMIDGIEINDVAQGALVDFTHIQMNNVERIEILRGPQSALWGSNAIAGIINIITKGSNIEDGKQVDLSFGIGDRETYQAAANLAMKKEKLALKLNFSSYKSDGENISRNQASLSNEQDAYSNTSLNGGLQYQFNQNNYFSVNSRITNYVADSDGYDFTTGLVGDADNESHGNQLSLGANWNFTFNQNENKAPSFSHLLSVQYNKQETKNYASKAFSGASIGEKLRFLWSNKVRFSDYSALNIGLESTREDFEQQGASVDAASNQRQSNSTNSFVLSGNYGFNEDLDLNYSYRYDDNSDFDSASSYRSGLVYRLSTDTKIFASIGEAIKNPTFTERFGFFPGSFLGNPNLVPEQQQSIEAGIESNVSSVSYQISVFKATLENEILGFVFEPASGQFTADNATSDSRRTGIELSTQFDIADISWQAQYSYVDAKESDIAELRRAKHNASLNATYQISTQQQFYLQIDYNGSKLDRYFPPFPEPSQIVSLKNYYLLSANYRYQIKQNLNVNLRLSNALNHRYEDVFGYNTDGSRALAQIQYTW